MQLCCVVLGFNLSFVGLLVFWGFMVLIKVKFGAFLCLMLLLSLVLCVVISHIYISIQHVVYSCQNFILEQTSFSHKCILLTEHRSLK